MGFQIESGIGNGKIAGVTTENRVMADCISSSIEHHVNHRYGEAYNIVFNQSPTAANDCIFYMKNTSDTDLVIEGITLGFKNATAVDLEFYIKLGDTGTRNSSTDIVPANLNAGSGNIADGDFEKGADLDGGTATLAGGVEVNRYMFANVQDQISTYFNFQQDIILPRNQTLTLWASDADATYYVILHMNYHGLEF
jgi:hypothetical protein